MRDDSEDRRKDELIEQLERRISSLKSELAMANHSNRRKNVELDALHFVWCNGGCEGGVNRYKLVAFPLNKNEDKEITCIYCNLHNCDLSYEVRGDGRISWCGVHSKCLPKRGNVTEAVVDEAVRNTERLVTWYSNKTYRSAWEKCTKGERDIVMSASDEKIAAENKTKACEKENVYLKELLRQTVGYLGTYIETDDGEDDADIKATADLIKTCEEAINR